MMNDECRNVVRLFRGAIDDRELQMLRSEEAVARRVEVTALMLGIPDGVPRMFLHDELRCCLVLYKLEKAQ